MSRVVDLEPWLSWEKLGEQLGGASKRWLEERLSEGMPAGRIAGKRVFKWSKVMPWLVEHGFVEDDAAA